MKKQKIQLIEKQVHAPGDRVRLSEDLDREYSRLIGIAVLDRIGSGHLLRSCTLASRELFPKDFEVDFLQTSNHVAPNTRFFTLNEKASGQDLEIEFEDNGTAIDPKRVEPGRTYPYTLKIYLLLEA